MMNPIITTYLKVSKVSFNTCTCVFSNGERLILDNRNSKPSENDQIYDIMWDSGDDIKINDWLLTHVTIKGTKIRRKINSLVFHDRDPRRIFRELSFDPLGETGDALFADMDPHFMVEMHPNYISADRLHIKIARRTRTVSPYYSRLHPHYNIDMKDTTSKIQEDVCNYFIKAVDHYNNLLSQAKDKLPSNYINMKLSSMSFEEFRNEWDNYTSTLSRYTKIGIIKSDHVILRKDEIKKAFDNGKGEFLIAYLETFSPILKDLETDYNRLNLFLNIMNERNKGTGKKYSFDSSKGFIISTERGALDVRYLSSGEKNDFIMFYDLIFNSEPNGLVLVDEPEISLHISWQEQYINYLLQICEMNNLQAIVATHSPHIINGHFELFPERGIDDAEN
jgi:hypothetical protein